MYKHIIKLTVLSFFFPTLVFAQEIKNFTIGGAFALTGTAKSYGIAELNASKMAIDDFNNINRDKIKFKITVEDTGSSNSKSLTAVSKLINLKGIRYILGPTWLDSFSSALPISKKKNVLLMSPSASIEVFEGNPLFYDLVFSTNFSSEKEVGGVLSYLKSKNKTKICTFMQEDPYILMMNRLMTKKALELGILIAKQIQPSADTTEYKTEIMKLTNADCDAVFYVVGGEDQTFTFLKQYKELGFNKELYSYSGVDNYVKNPIFKDLIENTFLVKPNKNTENFEKRYENEFGLKPEYIASNAYDAATILLTVLAKGITDTKEIALNLRNNFFDTITFGKVKFTEKGDVNAGKFDMYKVIDGKTVLVE